MLQITAVCCDLTLLGLTSDGTSLAIFFEVRQREFAIFSVPTYKGDMKSRICHVNRCKVKQSERGRRRVRQFPRVSSPKLFQITKQDVLTIILS